MGSCVAFGSGSGRNRGPSRSKEYARRRFNDHLNRFHYLLQGLDGRQIDPGKLQALESMDAILFELQLTS